MQRVKYPRTPHLYLSESITNDDKVLKDYSCFINEEIIITEKLDGENTTKYCDYIHARSIDSNNHPSRNYVKGLLANISHLIPDNFRICGENMYAKHSIHYNNLESYFYVFNIWENDTCLSYNETLEWCELLDLKFVPVLYEGKFDIKIIEKVYKSLDLTKQEGLVIRNTKSFKYDEFSNNVCKIVRPNHVNTDNHWMNNKLIKNELKNK